MSDKHETPSCECGGSDCQRPVTPENQRDEELSQYNLQRDIRTILKAYCNEESGKSRDKATSDILNLIDNQRQSWERWKKGLEERVRELEDQRNNAEQHLCQIGSDASLGLVALAEKASDRIYEQNMTIARLKAKVAELEEFKKRYAEAEDVVDLQDKVDRLSSALARAHEVITEMGICDCPFSTYYGSEKHENYCNLVIATKALADKSGTLALERWRKMEAVVSEARYLVVNGTMIALERCKNALEALDAKGERE